MCRTFIDRRWTPSSCLALSRLLERTFPAEYAARASDEQARPLPRLPHIALEGQKILPLFVLDSLLPGQRMFLHVFEVRYRLLIQRAIANHNNRFGMVGRSSTSLSQSDNNDDDGVARHGTEVEILSSAESPDGRFRVAVQGRSVFRILEKEHRDGYWEATVEDVGDDDNNEDVDATLENGDDVSTNNDDHTPKDLGEHVIRQYQRWEELVVENRWERHPNQLTDIKSALGAMPSAKEERKLAIWVAAAINPLPPLGVAREIRPAVLAATNPAEQLQIVSKTLDESMELVQHRRGTVNMLGLGRVDVALGTWIILGLLAWWFLQGYIRAVVLEKFGLESALLGVFGVIATSSSRDGDSSSDL